MFKYYTIKEVAEESGISVDQILRFGLSGDFIFSIIENKSKNYIDKEGIKNVTHSYISGDSKTSGLQLKYISTEDVINTLQNEKEDKKTLIRYL